MKYLILFALLGVVWWVWQKRRDASGKDSESARGEPLAEKMLTCAHCGVHLPESEGLLQDGKVYCCEAHRQAARSAPRG